MLGQFRPSPPPSLRKGGESRCPFPVILLALLAGGAAVVLCRYVFEFSPHIPDEISYLFQARIFASGKFWLNPPPVPDAFAVDHVVRSGSHWCSIYPPGWPLLLSIGCLAGVSWIVNPLMLALSTVGVWMLTVRLYDKRTAGVACVLFVASPFVLLMGSGFMAHMATLCASIWSVALLHGTTNKRLLVVSGLLAGIAFLVRPFSAVALLLPVLVYECLNRKFRNFIPMLLGFAPLLALFLGYNHFTFGSALETGYRLDPLWVSSGMQFAYLWKNLPWYWHHLNRSLWGFPWPDLLTFLPLLRPDSRWKRDVLLAACSVSLIVAHGFYYYTDVVYSGPRFAFESMGFISILAGRSLLSFIEALSSVSILRTKWLRMALLLLLLIFPVGVRLPAQVKFHSLNYHCQVPSLVNELEQSGIGADALVLVSGTPYVYGTFFMQNALNPAEGRHVFARDISSLRNELIREFIRPELWEVEVTLDPVKGPNTYPDRWHVRSFRTRRKEPAAIVSR